MTPRVRTGPAGLPHSKELLASAREFLVEALRSHHEHKDKFAIINAVTAAELMMKARVARVNPALVRRNIDSDKLDRERAVGLKELPQRLANLGKPLDAEAARLIGRFVDWRNELVHYLPTYDGNVARAQVPTLINFLAEYLDREFNVPLKSFLPRELYRAAYKELEKWKVIVATAADEARAEGEPLQEDCPECGAHGVLTVRKLNRSYCHVCESSKYRYDTCEICTDKTLVGFPGGPSGLDICVSCAEQAANFWSSQQSDTQR